MSATRIGRRPLVVVMGVSGSGKTTVGQALADRLEVEHADADDFHSTSSVAKMASGQPLDDTDRAPWLAAIGAWLTNHEERGGVVGCSALRRRYRDLLRSSAPRVVFLHLSGDLVTLTERLGDRSGHFMPGSLVASQLETLEPLELDEPGEVFNMTTSVDKIVAEFTSALRLSEDRS